jgi:hypothetical protein
MATPCQPKTLDHTTQPRYHLLITPTTLPLCLQTLHLSFPTLALLRLKAIMATFLLGTVSLLDQTSLPQAMPSLKSPSPTHLQRNLLWMHLALGAIEGSLTGPLLTLKLGRYR